MAEATASVARAATVTSADDQGKTGRGKRGKILLTVAVVLVLVVGFVLKTRSASTTHAAPTPGAVIRLDPIYLNLADGHFLKLGLGLRASASAPKDLDGAQALDDAIAVFSEESMSDLGDAATRARLKAKLIALVTRDYQDDVIDVYFTEFVMQ
jgi:flagellar FliL protein